LLVGAGIFFCLRRKKKTVAAKSPESQGSVPQPMAQNPGQAPLSPTGPEAYWSGVPPNQQYPQPGQPGQPGYDPHASIYSQQGYNQQHPQQPFGGYYSPQNPGFPQGQYPPQASPVSYHAPSTASPPPLTTPSPGVGTAPTPPSNVNELQAVNPVGHESNRAELGGPN
jgi:hypothetical protein